MKTPLALFLFIFPIFISSNSYAGWFDKTICVETDGQDRNGIIFLPNKTKPFNGNNLCEYENGQKKSKGEIVNGKKDGKWIFWFKNGQIHKEKNFKNGELDGMQSVWFENGLIDYIKYYNVEELPNSLFDILILKPLNQDLEIDIKIGPPPEEHFISKKSLKSIQELELYYVYLDQRELVNEVVGIKYYQEKNIEKCLKDRENLLKFFSNLYNVDKNIFSNLYFKASRVDEKKIIYIKNTSTVNYAKDNKDLIIDIFCEYHPYFQDNAVLQSSYPFFGSVGISLKTKKFYFENNKKSKGYVLNEITNEEFKVILNDFEERQKEETKDILNSLPKIK